MPRDEATRRFQNVCEAYDLLSDAVLRADYDSLIENENNLINQKKEPYLTNIKSLQFSKSIGVRRPPRSTRKESSAASDVYKRQE